MPIERNHGFRGQTPPTAGVERRGQRGRQIVDVIEQRLKQPRGRDDAFGDSFGEAGDGGLLAMDEKKPAPDRTAGGDPARQFIAVGMAGIVVDVANRRGDLGPVCPVPGSRPARR